MKRRGGNTKRGSENTEKGSENRKIGSENTRRKRILRDRERKDIKERKQKITHNGNSNTN